jgi:hypothetical protein
MNQLSILQQHQALCDEIHAAVLGENRFLRQHQRAPDATLTERKRALLSKLDESLTALRQLPAASARDPETRAQLEKTRGRILQILQLDQENEQLLLRCSLSAGRPAAGEAKPAGSVSMLQKIYARCS